MIPAYCHRCDLIFPSVILQIIGGLNIKNLELSGNSEPCPRCRNHAKTIEGTFNFNFNELEAINISGWTVDVLRRIKSLLIKATEKNADKDSIIESVEGLSPAVAHYLKSTRSSSNVFLLIIFLLLQLISRCEMKIEAKVDINELVDQYLKPSIEESKDLQEENHQEGGDSPADIPKVE